jgi:putative SOS response-associated peptidase YedK
LPVIQTTPDEFGRWMTADRSDASKVQRPSPDGTLRIVLRGEGDAGREGPVASNP